MIDIHSVPEADIESVRHLRNQYTDSDESIETVRDWYRDAPELFVGAYEEEDELVSYCLGLRGTESVEFKGIAVTESRQRQGIGTVLLALFEDHVVSLGFERIGLGSAGGYVDEFYLDNGYTPKSILVRRDPDDLLEDYRESDYEIIDETVDNGTKKLSIDVDEFDPTFVEEVQDAFDDPAAIYIMEKHLDSSSQS